MKIPKFKPPGNSERNESYLSILVLMLAVFMLVLIGIVSQGATVHASVVTPDLSTYPYSTSWDYQYRSQEADLPSYDRRSSIVSKYPIYGYLKGGIWRMALVDFESGEYYELTGASTDDSVNSMYYFTSAFCQTNNKDGTTTTTINMGNVSYQGLKNEYGSGYAVCAYIQQNDYTIVSKCTVTVFESEDALKAFIQTGELVGVIHEGDVIAPDRDFGEEYDPDIPIPELTNISHNGFTVANAAENLEIDLVVESRFYGLIHYNQYPGLYTYDKTSLINSHKYDCTYTADIGYTKAVYNLAEDFDCSNVDDLYSDGNSYFTTYTTHKSLPSYEWTKHSGETWTKGFTVVRYPYVTEGIAKHDALMTSNQAQTKYYVRFLEMRLNEEGVGATMVPGQWYSYTYCYDIDDGGGKVIVSPVGGDENGNPVETDPEEGNQGDDGIPDYSDPPINYSGDSLLEIITGIFGDLTEMISAFQGFADFLVGTFAFIPSNIWSIVRIGVGLSVVLLVWRFVVK